MVWTRHLDGAALTLPAEEQGREGQLCCWWQWSPAWPARKESVLAMVLPNRADLERLQRWALWVSHLTLERVFWKFPTSKKTDAADVPVQPLEFLGCIIEDDKPSLLFFFNLKKKKIGKSKYTISRDTKGERMWSEEQGEAGPREGTDSQM